MWEQKPCAVYRKNTRFVPCAFGSFLCKLDLYPYIVLLDCFYVVRQPGYAATYHIMAVNVATEDDEARHKLSECGDSQDCGRELATPVVLLTVSKTPN